MISWLRFGLASSHRCNTQASAAFVPHSPHRILAACRVTPLLSSAIGLGWLVHHGQCQKRWITPGAVAVTDSEPIQQAADPADSSVHVDDDAIKAFEVLNALSWYQPTGLSDGPASLTQVRPYNAAEVQHALSHGATLLNRFRLRKLSNMAAALAAAAHLDRTFMEQLGLEVSQQLKSLPPADDHVAALAELKAVCFLAVAYARLGVLHVELMKQVAIRGTSLLQRHKLLRPSKRIHGQHLALLAAAFAALKIHPPQLLTALGELFKQQRHVLWLLGPEESMLLLWAFARVQHKDAPAQMLLTQRAVTQVGQLDCQGLAHAYTQCASAGLTAPPLLAALRKSTRQRLRGMRPQHLTAVLMALAGLGQQDSLLLDELSGALHNKMANMTAAQVSTCFTACSILRYRNPWLFDQASKMLVSRKLNKAAQLTAIQLADILVACSQLQYHNGLLFAHLGTTAADRLCGSWTAADLAAVLQGYCFVSFYQPPLLLAAAPRLLELTAAGKVQQQQELDVASLIDAAYWLVQMPPAGGTAAEQGSRAATVHSVAGAALQDQQIKEQRCSLQEYAKLGVTLLLTERLQAQADIRWQQQQQQQVALLPTVLKQICERLEGITAADGLEGQGPELLQLMQLLWLVHVQKVRMQEQHWQQEPSSEEQQQQPMWQLGLPEVLVQQVDLWVQQQQICQSSPLVQVVIQAVQRRFQGSEGVQVVSLFKLPGSPVTVPVAVRFTSSAPGAASSQKSAALQGAHSTSPEVFQQEHIVVAEVQMGHKGVVLPPDMLALLQDCRAAGRPVAIVDSSSPPWLLTGVGGSSAGWLTRSEPRQTTSVGAIWQQGLVSAGWSVVILLQRVEEDTDA